MKGLLNEREKLFNLTKEETEELRCYLNRHLGKINTNDWRRIVFLNEKMFNSDKVSLTRYRLWPGR